MKILKKYLLIVLICQIKACGDDEYIISCIGCQNPKEKKDSDTKYILCVF